MSTLPDSYTVGWEKTLLAGYERHLDDGPLRHVHPRKPWVSVWWNGLLERWDWAVWPRLTRVNMVVMEQRRLGVGAHSTNGRLDEGHGTDLRAVLDQAREALEAHA